MWCVHISKYHRSIKKNELNLKVSTWVSLQECIVENGYVWRDTIYVNVVTHKTTYTNRLWIHIFVARRISNTQVDTHQLQVQDHPRSGRGPWTGDSDRKSTKEFHHGHFHLFIYLFIYFLM